MDTRHACALGADPEATMQEKVRNTVRKHGDVFRHFLEEVKHAYELGKEDHVQKRRDEIRAEAERVTADLARHRNKLAEKEQDTHGQLLLSHTRFTKGEKGNWNRFGKVIARS